MGIKARVCGRCGQAVFDYPIYWDKHREPGGQCDQEWWADHPEDRPKEKVWEHTCSAFKHPEIVALKEFVWACPHCGVVQPKKEKT